MSYADHFKLTDDLIVHLDGTLVAVTDPFISSRYTGFLAVSAATVYELALKTIFLDFATQKHKVLACFTQSFFERINGRIKIDIIKKDYIPKYGAHYLTRFTKQLEQRERTVLRSTGRSMKSSYGNIISWRNDFAHEGRVPANPTYDEVKSAYSTGKDVLHCLAGCMKR